MKHALAIVLILLLAACGGSSDGRPADLTILAGSELKDIVTLQPEIESATGLKLKFEYSGTLDMVDRLAGTDGARYDLAWAASNKYLMLAAGNRIKASEKIMLSPVVLGLKRSKVEALGWNQKEPTWADIAQSIKDGKLAYAMSNPTSSNTGFSAVVGVAAALSGRGDGLEVADIQTDALRTFFSGIKLTAGSSGWLVDAYLADQDRLDGMINYESVILSLNQAGTLHERLVAIYPKEGIITADYPLMLLKDAQRPAFDKLATYLKSEAFQNRVMQTTFRRPVNPAVKPAAVFGDRLLVELPFPGRLDVVDALLTAYLDDLRVPSSSYFVLDKSGSMGNEGRMDNLKAALLGLTGGGATIGERFSRLQSRERVVLTKFDNRVDPPQQFDFSDPARRGAVLDEFRAAVNAIEPEGGTAIYDALTQVYRNAAGARAADGSRYYTIVLMTDGENTSGDNYRNFENYYSTLPESSRGIRVFPILFGEGSADEMKKLALLTGGRVFDGRKQSLAVVFKEIRGYQ